MIDHHKIVHYHGFPFLFFLSCTFLVHFSSKEPDSLWFFRISEKPWTSSKLNKTSSSYLELHCIYCIQDPAHSAITSTHQHPDPARGQQGAQLEGFGRSQLRKVKHLEKDGAVLIESEADAPEVGLT